MKKLILGAMLCLASALFGQTSTTYTGTIKDLSGANVTSGQVTFQLMPGSDTTISGLARFTGGVPVTCTINGSGLVKALDGSSACTVTNNTSLTPSGTYYQACIQPQFIVPGSCFNLYALGGSIDLSTVVPTPSTVPAYNFVDLFSNQTISGNKTFSGTSIFNGNTTINGSLTYGTLNGTAWNIGALGTANSGANFNSGTANWVGSYWTGVAAASDTWTWKNVVGTGTNPSVAFTLTHAGSSGPASINLNGNNVNMNGAQVSGVGNFNGIIWVDGTKYPLTAAGIQAAITDAQNGGGEIHLPCGKISISATLNVTAGPLAIVGCSGGDVNNSGIGSTQLFYTGSAGSDLLNIDCTPNRCSGIRMTNVLLDGNLSARYPLRMNSQDVTVLTNVKARNGVTANWYHVNSTGTTVNGGQVTCNQAGGAAAGAGLVIDWGSSVFNAYNLAFDTAACNATAGILLWIGGGSNRSINFFGGQSNINVATAKGFINITGYDVSSPWPSSGTPTVGAPSNVYFYGMDLLYGANTPAAASQGADVLISGTAANLPSNIYFNGGKFDGRLASGGASIAVKSDFASNVQLQNLISQGHTAGSACTFNVTSNTTSPGGSMLNVNSTNVPTPDTNRTCGTVTSIADASAVLGAWKFNGLTRVGLGSDVFANLGTPANGVQLYCSDCNIANPCTNAGTGAFAKRINGAWVCN